MSGHELTVTVRFDETDEDAVRVLRGRAQQLDAEVNGQTGPDKEYPVGRCLALLLNLDDQGLAWLWHAFDHDGPASRWIARPHIDICGYPSISEDRRDAARSDAREDAVRADRRYADLLAAEAGIAARAALPTIDRLVFMLSHDFDGQSATLVAAYTATDQLLWHRDQDDEWPDESLVTDRLAAAWEWSRGDYFPPAGEDSDLLLLQLHN